MGGGSPGVPRDGQEQLFSRLQHPGTPDQPQSAPDHLLGPFSGTILTGVWIYK